MSSLGFSSLLLRLPAGAGTPSLAAKKYRLAAAGAQFELQPLFTVHLAAADRVGLAAQPAWEWYRVQPAKSVRGAHPWDLAHAALQQGRGLAPGAALVLEPDLEQEWFYENPVSRVPGLAANLAACIFNDQAPRLPHIDHRFAWHLDDDFSQLGRARTAAGNNQVRIAHLDTGYDPTHKTFPAHVNLKLQKNFIDDQPDNDAHDPGARGFMKNPGHGTGTLRATCGKYFYIQRLRLFVRCSGGWRAGCRDCSCAGRQVSGTDLHE